MKYLIALSLLTCATNPVFAEVQELKENASKGQEPKEQEINLCSEEMLISHFPPTIVKNTLKKFEIPEKNWDAIVQKLQEQNQKVYSSVEAIAEKAPKNPLKDPKLRKEAVQIFQTVLKQVFSEVMTQNGVTDQNKIDAMLQDILKQKQEQFTHCLKEFQGSAE
jgi:hypothetical protein